MAKFYVQINPELGKTEYIKLEKANEVVRRDGEWHSIYAIVTQSRFITSTGRGLMTLNNKTGQIKIVNTKYGDIYIKTYPSRKEREYVVVKDGSYLKDYNLITPKKIFKFLF